MFLRRFLTTALIVLMTVIVLQVYFYLTLKHISIKTTPGSTNAPPNCNTQQTPYHESLKSFVAEATDYIEDTQSFRKNMYSVMRYSGTITDISIDTSTEKITVVLSNGSNEVIGEYRAFPISKFHIYKSTQNQDALLTIKNLQKGTVVDVREYSSVHAPGREFDFFIEFHLLNEVQN